MPRAALLNYFVGADTTWLFLLRPDGLGPVAHDTSVPAAHLQACAERLFIDCHGLHADWAKQDRADLIRRALALPPAVTPRRRPPNIAWTSPDPLLLKDEYRYAMTYLDELSAALLPDAIRPLLDDCNVLCISPHGPLHSLPLHALRWANGGYLIERFGVCYVPSAGVLRHCQARNRARQLSRAYRPRTCLVAGVDMLGGQVEAFEKDGDFLAPLFDAGGPAQPCQLLSGVTGEQAATKRRVIQHIDKYDLVHLACHGLFAGDWGWQDPLESGLLLADGRRSQVDDTAVRNDAQLRHDCLLTARELFNLSLTADMVTLRACYTGRAAVAAGDELLGLSRAFLYAGAPSLLVSLWNVHTKSSRQLLETFYRQWLEAGQPKWLALKQAQQALLGDANERYHHPYHWAPFGLIGDWV